MELWRSWWWTSGEVGTQSDTFTIISAVGGEWAGCCGSTEEEPELLGTLPAGDNSWTESARITKGDNKGIPVRGNSMSKLWRPEAAGCVLVYTKKCTILRVPRRSQETQETKLQLISQSTLLTFLLWNPDWVLCSRRGFQTFLFPLSN